MPFYDPIVGLLGFDRARQELIDQAKVEPGHRVLDVGCGTGSLIIMLKRRYAAAEIVGLDPDPKALGRAENKLRRVEVSAQLNQGFADELPYEAGSFDRVFSSFMFHHLEEQDREKALQEVRRVLKPVGSFHLLDFAVAGEIIHGHSSCLIHSNEKLKDSAPPRITQLMRNVGFKDAVRVKDGKMFFGLLQTAYYQASV